MKKNIFKSNYFFAAIFLSISILVLLIEKGLIFTILRFPMLFIILSFSIYLNPILIIKTLIDKEKKILQDKLIFVLSYVLLSLIYAFLAIFLFTKSYNVLDVAKIISIVNFVFLIIAYFLKGEYRDLVIKHLIVSLIFTSLIGFL